MSRTHDFGSTEVVRAQKIYKIMTLKEKALFILELHEGHFITVEEATRWAGLMFEKHDYDKLDLETQDALASVEILDVA